MAHSVEFLSWAAQYGGVEEGNDNILECRLRLSIKDGLAIMARDFEKRVPGSSVETAVLSSDRLGGSAREWESGRFFVAVFNGKIKKTIEILASVRGNLIETQTEFDLLASFTAHHEFAHLRHGHVSWSGQTPRAEISDFDRQTLEFDADIRAIHEVSLAFLGVRNAKDETGQIKHFLIINESPASFWLFNRRAKILGSAVYTHFWMANDRLLKIWTPDQGVTSEVHPPVSVRFCLVLSWIQTMLNDVAQRHPALAEQASMAVLRGGIEREERIANLNGTNPVFTLQKACISKGVWRYHGLLSDNWRRLRPKLAPFVMEPDILAPAQDAWPDAPEFFIDP
jgi:hypothetical protein